MIPGGVKSVMKVSDDLRETCYDIMEQCQENPDHIERFYQCVQKDINNLNEIMFYFEENGVVQGFIKGRLDNNMKDSRFKLSGPLYARLDWLYVSPKCHRFGVGSRLLRTYINHVSRSGAKEIAVISNNTEKANAFYRKHGFVPMQQAAENMVKSL